jgi:iron complex transport system substrate-binding protein
VPRSKSGRIGKRVRFPRGPATVMLSKPPAIEPLINIGKAAGGNDVRNLRVCETKSGDLPEACREPATSAREVRRARALSGSRSTPRGLGRRELFFLNKSGSDRSNRHRRSSLARPVSRVTVFLIIVSVFSSCGRPTPSSPETRTVVDELDRTVHIPIRPERIVSLAPSVTEALFALEAGDRVVGVTSYCDYPPAARLKESVGDTLKPSVERIVALRADLVIVSTASQLESSVQKLEELGIPVYVTNPRTIEGVLESIAAIGGIIGVPDVARQLTDRLRSRISSIESRASEPAPPSVLVILGTEPLITAGAASFINDLVNRAGGRSISADVSGDYPQYSLETAVAKQPQVIFLQAGGSVLPERLKETPAAVAGRVYRLDDDLLLRPGPRVVDGLEQMAARIHPDAFKVSDR